MRWGTHSMLGVLEVKGEATDASCSDREMPTWAIFKACKQRVGLLPMYANLYTSTEGQKVTCDRQPDFTYLPSKKEVSLVEVSLGYLPKEEGTPESSSPLGHSNHWIFCSVNQNLPKSLVSVDYIHDNDTHCKNFWEILATHWQPLTPQSLAPSPHMPTK